MITRRPGALTLGARRVVVREPAVAGAFYPAGRAQLQAMVRALLASSGGQATDPGRVSPAPPAGLLVPHAGLVYSGVLAAAAWSTLARPDGHGSGPDVRPGSLLDTGTEANLASRSTIVILGTNHGATWLDGVAAWDAGAWRTPLGDVEVDEELARDIVELGSPFVVDRFAHQGEHSIEVQLPLLQVAAPHARIVPLAVSIGTGRAALDAGRRLGELLALRRARGDAIILAISSDMAHYPSARACAQATRALLPAILAVDAHTLADRERAVRDARTPGLVCGMCGIQPAVMGLATLRAIGATAATCLGVATSADAGAPPDRTVGYLAVRFDLADTGAEPA